MRFDIQKFMEDTNHSHLYHDWNNNLLEMNEALGDLPTLEDGTHTWMIFIGKAKAIKIGFDRHGMLKIDYVGNKDKDDNKGVLNKKEIKTLTDTILNTITIFDEFGFIVHPTEKGGAE